MRALVQRVKESGVSVAGELVNNIGRGLLILLGVKQNDNDEAAKYLAQRCSCLRIFEDRQGKMNLSVKDIDGEILVISQFTLYADTRRGNRPGFTDAADPVLAEKLYEKFVGYLRIEMGDEKVKTGIFRKMMDIQLINEGPVTIMLESKES